MIYDTNWDNLYRWHTRVQKFHRGRFEYHDNALKKMHPEKRMDNTDADVIYHKYKRNIHFTGEIMHSKARGALNKFRNNPSRDKMKRIKDNSISAMEFSEPYKHKINAYINRISKH